MNEKEKRILEIIVEHADEQFMPLECNNCQKEIGRIYNGYVCDAEISIKCMPKCEDKMLDKQKVISKMKEIIQNSSTCAYNTPEGESIRLRNAETRGLFMELFANIKNSKLYDYEVKK